ncbi:MAG: hypothetical protein ACOC0P_02330 [Planctomycetota bacterium]
MAAMIGLTGGCVSVPPEAAELNEAVTERLDEFERTHVAMLHELMDERRTRIDTFMEEEWIPTFAENLLEEEAIMRLFRIASDDAMTDADRVRAMNLIGTRVQAAINEQRAAMMEPLDRLERSLERRLRDEYLFARYINDQVTTYLVSAADVAAIRDRYADAAGVDESAVRNAIDETNLVLDDLNAQAGTIEERSDAFISRLNEIISMVSRRD